MTDHPRRQDAVGSSRADEAAGKTPSPEPADPRQASVLRELAKEDEAVVSFQGLKRRLGLHQQKLTRALDRLVEAGLVADEVAGYQLTEAGFDALAGQTDLGPRCPDRPIAHALIPPELDADAIADAMAERWFKELRWYGRADGPGETSLIWLTEPGGRRVRLRLAGGTFTVTTDCCRELDPELFAAVHRLVSAVTELYQDVGGPPAGS